MQTAPSICDLLSTEATANIECPSLRYISRSHTLTPTKYQEVIINYMMKKHIYYVILYMPALPNADSSRSTIFLTAVSNVEVYCTHPCDDAFLSAAVSNVGVYCTHPCDAFLTAAVSNHIDTPSSILHPIDQCPSSCVDTTKVVLSTQRTTHVIYYLLLFTFPEDSFFNKYDHSFCFCPSMGRQAFINYVAPCPKRLLWGSRKNWGGSDPATRDGLDWSYL